MRPSKLELEPRLLESTDYPIDKNELLKRAREMNVPDAVREAVLRLRSGTFRSRGNFLAAVEAIVGQSD